MKRYPTKISVIITTFNWPYALRAVLSALADQKSSCPFEIIVADDGSTDETAKLIRSFKNRISIPLLHIWQPNEGFRAAAIRNKAILAAEGDYIVFLDGDCIPREDFIASHAGLAEPKTFVAGNRVLLSREFTLSALSRTLPLHQWTFWRWCLARILGLAQPTMGLQFFDHATDYYFPDTIDMLQYGVVYTDVIEYQYLGNKKTPVLKIIPISLKNDNSIISYSDLPQYVRVSKNIIDTINISIVDLEGLPIQFENLFATVIVKLHLRKCQL